MKTISGWFHLRGLFLVSGAVALGSLLCASANADTVTYREAKSRPHTAQNMPAAKKIDYYIVTSSSPIPKPISYIIGGVVTTAVPVEIIGRGDTIIR